MESDTWLKQNFGTLIKQLREEKAVSQQVVADNCNLERAFISRLERGISEPSLSTIFKMAAYFGVAPGTLLDWVTKI